MKTYTSFEILEFAYQITNKEIAETKEILMKQNKDGFSVAHRLVWDSGYTSWSTEDNDILKLQDKEGNSVAHWLSFARPTWTTDIPEILSISDELVITVEDLLIERNKI